MIYRIKKGGQFFQCPNAAVEREGMSFKAKGVLCYLLSKPPTWTPRVGEISSIGPDGKEAIQSALKELSEFGYASLEIETDEKGASVGRCWNIYEDPALRENRSERKPHCAKIAICGHDASSNTGLLNNTNQEQHINGDLNQMVVEIYALYPLKVGKPAALKAIRSVLKSNFPPAALLSATAAYAKAVNGADKHYIPHPSTWFGQHRFKDDPDTWVRRPSISQKQPWQIDRDNRARHAALEREITAIENDWKTYPTAKQLTERPRLDAMRGERDTLRAGLAAAPK